MKEPEVSMLGGKRLAQFVNACCNLATESNVEMVQLWAPPPIDGGEHCDARRISVGQSGKADLTFLLQGMEGMPETEEMIGMFASAASDTDWMRSAELLRPLFGDLIAFLLCHCSQIGNGVWFGLAILLLRQFTTWLEVNMERTISMASSKHE